MKTKKNFSYNSDRIPITVETPPVRWLDYETEAMCRKNNILPYIETIRDTIYKIYEGVKSVKVELVEDLSSDRGQIDFEIHITGEPARILEDEERFYSLFFQEVPKNKQKFFVFSYRVYSHESY